MLVAPADHVFGLPLAGVFGVAHRIRRAGPTVRAEHLDLVSGLGELEVRVGQLGPPEPDGPAGRGRHPRVGDHDGDPPGLKSIGVLVTHDRSSTSSGVRRDRRNGPTGADRVDHRERVGEAVLLAVHGAISTWRLHDRAVGGATEDRRARSPWHRSGRPRSSWPAGRRRRSIARSGRRRYARPPPPGRPTSGC